MNKLPNLYKIDSRGKTRVIKFGYDSTHYVTYSGIDGGKLIARETYPKPKGKRTLAEQVESEVRSKWKRKHERELYSEDLSKTHPHSFIQPMLAHDATKVGHRIDWDNKEYVGQAKLNGVRCIAQYKNSRWVLTSRKGKIYEVPHISNALANQIKDTKLILDGELYIHGTELGDITHAVSHGDNKLEYHIFDIVDTSLSYDNRFGQISTLQLKNPIKTVNVFALPDLKFADEVHDELVNRGFEGLMIKQVDSKYEHKRSPGLFKYKKFQDAEFKIIRVERDKDGGAIAVLDNGKKGIFKARPIGSDELRIKLFVDREKLIGKMATIKYSGVLKSGNLEFPRLIAIRNYE